MREWFPAMRTWKGGTAYEMAFDKSCLNEVTNNGIPEEALSSPSLNAEEANLTHLPLQLVKRVFRKAQSLLEKEDAIVQVPGSKEMAFMVESKTSRRHHDVYIKKSGKNNCENCPGCSSTKFCQHSVAVAEKTQNLEKFLEWLRRRST